MDKKIYKNTLILYIRTLVSMALALYTSRIVLEVLGIDDFGIYNLIAGIVILFQSVSTTLAGSTQRFINYALGQTDKPHYVSQVFSVAVKLHLWLALGVVVAGETLGLWFINTCLNVDPSKIIAANFVYQCTLLSFALEICNLPYMSLVIAHERFSFYAYILIVQSLVKVGNVYFLLVFDYDKLIVYALLEFLLTITIRGIFNTYCRFNFEESKIIKVSDKSLYKEMGKFAGWNFFGTSANIVYEQGGNILLNHFWGVALNAARGLTSQVARAVSIFVSNFTVALNPQITQNWSAGNRQISFDLVMKGGKLSFYLLFVISAPIILNVDYILHLWLKIVPDYTAQFVVWSLYASLVGAFTPSLHCLLFATGCIKNYQILVSLISVGRLFVLLLLWNYGGNPIMIYVLTVVFQVIHIGLLLSILNRFAEFPVWHYTKYVLLPVIIVAVIGMTIICQIQNSIRTTDSFTMFVTETIGIVSFLSFTIILLGVNKRERNAVKEYMCQKIGIV